MRRELWYLITRKIGSINSIESYRLRNVTKSNSFWATSTRGRRCCGSLEKHRPQVVFHAAAHKHVDFLEGQVLGAVRTNVFGTRNVLTASVASGVESIVVLSSDKATNPISVLGVTKRVAELLVLANCEQANVSAVRLCNVLGTAGSLLPLVAEQVAKGRGANHE